MNQEEPKTPDQQWADKLGVANNATPPQYKAPENGNRESCNGSMPPPEYKPRQTMFPNVDARLQQGSAEKMPPTYFIWSILVTLLCCSIGGIVAIVFSSQVSSRYYAGDMEGARKASKRAEIWIIIAFVLGMITNTLYLPILLSGGI